MVKDVVKALTQELTRCAVATCVGAVVGGAAGAGVGLWLGMGLSGLAAFAGIGAVLCGAGMLFLYVMIVADTTVL